jgi:modulator of FtsH protease
MFRVMPASNDPAAWQNFYVMMGGANAALTGLVFVALSIHLKEVLDHALLRSRAVIAITVLATQIVIAAIVLTPQDPMWMGAEIFLLNASFLAVELMQRRRFTINRGSLTNLALRLGTSTQPSA